MAARKNQMPTITGDDTGAQDATTGFDFDAWLGEATPAQRTVTVYGNNALQADIARLEQERERVIDAAQEDGGHNSWGGDAEPDTNDIDKQIKALKEELAKSGVTFRLQAIDPDVDDEIERQYKWPKDSTDDEKQTLLVKQLIAKVAAQIIEPRRFTEDEVQKLRRAIGEPEFMKLVNVAAELRSNSAASDPFSPVSFGTART